MTIKTQQEVIDDLCSPLFIAAKAISKCVSSGVKMVTASPGKKDWIAVRYAVGSVTLSAGNVETLRSRPVLINLS